MYKVLKKCGRAKRAEFHTPHGVIQTPVFMNVGTAGAMRAAGYNELSHTFLPLEVKLIVEALGEP